MRLRNQIVISLALTLLIAVVQAVYRRQTQGVRSPPSVVGVVKFGSGAHEAPRASTQPDASSFTRTKGYASATFVKYPGGQIMVGSEYLQIKGDLFDGLILVPGFTVSGKRLKAPDSVTFKFISYSTESRFPDMQEVTISTDGRTLFTASLLSKSFSEATQWNQTRSEIAEVQVPYNIFARLCRSKIVRLSTGGDPIPLPNDELEKLRNINELVNEGPSFK